MNVKKARVFCYFRHGIFIIVFASINSRTRKREREREREDVSRWSKNYKKLNLRKINFSEFRIYRTYYHYYTIITIDRSRNGESFFVPFFFLLSSAPIERSKKRAQLTFRKAQEHAKENRIKGYRASVKKGGPQGALLEFDIGTRQIHAYLEAFALLIKGGPGPRPRASKRRAAKKRGARGRRRRDYLPALSPLLLSGNARAKLRRIAHTRASTRGVRARVPPILRRYETKRRFYANLCGSKSARLSREGRERRRQPT